ncbi:MAG: glycosyltransferase family 4 protein [Bacilli bacterium]|nr:glycosyltransferase family 4 protein [Methanobrevibacter sp.]MBR0059835.1 glycosyltransferase family 4 protein [Methanobrevibacter sp.]MBR0440146.1 glycosyltransferase family 4 protein [Bacilli bacterium]
MAEERRYKIVYCTPALYMAGGVERVLTLKANYFAEHCGYDITIILTEGKDKPFFYPLSEKIKVINLDVNFEDLWTCTFLKKILVYLKKQRLFKKKLASELKRLKPDLTISLLRREINFITSIQDGSKKIGELHINRAHYRNFEGKDASFVKTQFSKIWMHDLVGKLQKLDTLVVLTEKDKESWIELNNVQVIPDPLSFHPSSISPLSNKRVIAVGRYSHEKGYDLLLSAWKMVSDTCKDWKLEIFGDGDHSSLDVLLDQLQIDKPRCVLHGRTSDVEKEYLDSSIFVCSSRFEGFGMVILEAMACGLPVISFDCPWGPGSIISDGVDGYLVNNGDTKNLAEKIISLINSEEDRVRVAKNALNKSNQYSIDTIALQWKCLFDTLMK